MRSRNVRHLSQHCRNAFFQNNSRVVMEHRFRNTVSSNCTYRRGFPCNCANAKDAPSSANRPVPSWWTRMICTPASAIPWICICAYSPASVAFLRYGFTIGKLVQSCMISCPASRITWVILTISSKLLGHPDTKHFMCNLVPRIHTRAGHVLSSTREKPAFTCNNMLMFHVVICYI